MRKIMLIGVTILLVLAGGWTLYRRLAQPKIPDLQFFPPETVVSRTTPSPVPTWEAVAGPTIIIVPTDGPINLEGPTIAAGGSGCYSACGDLECEEVVCQGSGCPCAETPQNCPRDCK